MSYDIGTNSGLNNSEIAQALSDFADSKKPMEGTIDASAGINVAVMGASIFEDWGERSSCEAIFTGILEGNGIPVDSFANYAVSGNYIADAITVADTVIADYAGVESSTHIPLHIGGNNASANGPYPGGNTTIDADYRELLEKLITAGFNVHPFTLSYRTPPASNVTSSYNELTIIPIIQELVPTAVSHDGRPLHDFHQFTLLYNKDNQRDGIHYTEAGDELNAEFVANSLCKVLAGAGEAIPATAITDVIIDFSARATETGITNISTNTTLASAVEEDGTVIDIGMTIAGFSSGEGNASGTARGITGYNLLSDGVVSDSIFVCDPTFSEYDGGDYGMLTFDGESIIDTDSYTLTLCASRGTASTDTNRMANVTVNGTSQILDASDSDLGATPTVSWALTGAELKASGIKVERTTLSSGYFAYVGGLQLTKVV